MMQGESLSVFHLHVGQPSRRRRATRFCACSVLEKSTGGEHVWERWQGVRTAIVLAGLSEQR